MNVFSCGKQTSFYSSAVILIILILMAVSSTGPAQANTDAVGAGSMLRTGVDARALGMGGAFVAIADNYAAAHWNPAGVTRARSIYLGGMHQDKFGLGLNLNYLSGGIPLTNLPFGINSPLSSLPLIDDLSISGTYNGFSTSVKAANPGGNPVGTITYSERVYKGTVGFSLSQIGSIGVTGKTYRFRAPKAGRNGKTAKAHGLGFDAGLLAEPLDNFWVGAAGFDLTGTTIQWENTPSEPENIAPARYSAGAAYNLDMSGLPLPKMMEGTTTFAGQYTFGPNITNKIRTGLEYDFSIFSLRGGLIRSEGGTLEFTAGAGLDINLLSADVAWVQNNSVEANNTSDTVVISTEFTF